MRKLTPILGFVFTLKEKSAGFQTGYSVGYQKSKVPHDTSTFFPQVRYYFCSIIIWRGGGRQNRLVRFVEVETGTAGNPLEGRGGGMAFRRCGLDLSGPP